MLGSKYTRPKALRWGPEDVKKAGTRYVDRSVSPEYMYSPAEYPDTLSGSLYVVPFGSVECLYAACLALPLFHLNDVFLTALAAEACGVARIGDPRFNPGEEPGIP